MVVANNEIDEAKNAGKSMAISMAMAMQWQWYDAGAHCPIKHIQGFTRSHWMPPSGECLRRIALTVAMVDEFE
jgi:hypothetical protein